MNADEFAEHRDLLFAVAYRMLGTAADAEDVVQDAWLRWSGADRSAVVEPKAYLVRITTNLALDRLRSAQVRRESYVGPWLPEPMLTAPDVAEGVEMAESVSMAMLVVLETLSPLERAVFVLHEVFGYPHAKIAATLGRSETSVRQLGHRARQHVEARRPRFKADETEQRKVTEEFLAAATGGDMERLVAVLAPEVTMVSDGGGKRRAALRPIRGVDHVARWLTSVIKRPYEGVPIEDIEIRPVRINGAPGWIFYGDDGKPLSAMSLEITDDRVQTIHLVVNPDKLQAVAAGRELPL